VSTPGASQVCLVLTGPTLADCRRQLAESRSHIDLAELRADLIDRKDWAGLNEFSQKAGLPLVLTLRQVADGGQFSGTADERLAFFRVACDGAWTWFDLEDDQRLPDLEAAWLEKGRQLIVSFHDFHGVPAGWIDRLQAAQGPGITAKAAVFPQSSAEYLRFLRDLLDESGRPRIEGRYVALAMGGFGFSSRVLAARLGSRWTYASPVGTPPAPGLTDPATLQNLYHFWDQTPETPVFGILGNPVFHTKSPIIHNPALARLGIRGTYVPFLVDELAPFFQTADLLDVRGLSCTIPFKEDVLLHLGEMSAAVRETGACNTLWRAARGPWSGDNTDAPGFMAPLADLAGTLAGKKATVIGTGGAARGVVWALKREGVRVVVLGRSPDKAMALAGDFGVEWAPLGPESRLVVEEHNDILVQTTSVGMGEAAGQDPLAWYDFTGREIAYDIIYVPRWTPFLTRAKDAGCRILFGEDMLVNQAFGQFRRFTGKEYPKDVLDLG
jgi:3-dehydroquinate dehydratase/shikimate dehydrogenase